MTSTPRLVRDLMATKVVTLGRNESLTTGDDLMRLGRIRHLPVVAEDGTLAGIVSQRDLFQSGLLRALGYEPSPAGGPDFCCGSTKDSNAVAADGMAQRTVDRLNKRGADRVVAWCPSCHLQSAEFMEKG